MKKHLPAIALAVGMLSAGAYLAFYLHQEVKAQVLSQFNESQLLIAQDTAGDMASYFDARSGDVRYLSSLTSLQHLDATTMPADIQATFARLKSGYVQDIVVLDSTGKVVYSATGSAVGAENAGSPVEAWAREPLSKGVVRLVVEKSDNLASPRLGLVTPLYQNPPTGAVPDVGGTRVGMLRLTVGLDKLVEGTLGAAPTKNVHPLETWVMDGDGTLLVQPGHPEMVLNNIRRTGGECLRCHVSFDYAEKMLTAKLGTLEYQIKGRPRKVAAFAPMTFADASWIVVVDTQGDDITSFIRTNSIETLGLFGVVGIVVGFTFFSVYRNSRQAIINAERAKHLEEQERLIEQLRETSEYLENLFASANAPIIVWNPELRITRLNRACERLTGYAASELVGLELRTIFPEESREESLSKILQALGTEEGESPEIPILRKNGEIRIALWNSANIRSGDGTSVIAMIAQGKDITLRRQVEVALRESEERFRNLFESSRDAIMTLEPPSWKFTSGNPATVKMFGAKDQEEFVSFGPGDVSPERQPDGRESAEKAKEMIETALRDGSRFFEWTHRRIGGEEFPADVLLTRMGHDQNVIIQATVRDITERKQTEQMKADFVSFATHQLRTPLSGIRWLLELAEQTEGMPEEVVSLVADARTSAERLIALVNDLLAVSRIEGGRLDAEPQPVDLSGVTADVVNELMPLAREKNQQIRLPDGVPVPLAYADPKLVREVLLNLLSNAIKYTPQDGSIAVSMKADRDMVQWAVRDTGIGVPVNAQRRLFEKFYRAENATITNTEGTGLGLYLVRLILGRSGGRVWCESEEGRGSTFWFRVATTLAPVAPTVTRS